MYGLKPRQRLRVTASADIARRSLAGALLISKYGQHKLHPASAAIPANPRRPTASVAAGTHLTAISWAGLVPACGLICT
jgi:hypothetical protein